MALATVITDLPPEAVAHPSRSLVESNACNTRRKFESVETQKEKNTVYDRSVFIKHAIINYFIAKEMERKKVDVTKYYQDYVLDDKAPVSMEDAHLTRLIKDCVGSVAKDLLAVDPLEAPKMIANFLDFDYIKEYIHESFKSLTFYTERTRRIQADQATDLVLRYLEWETRTPVLMGRRILKIHGVYVIVKPDLVFFDRDGSVEVVIIRTGKPTVTQKGRTTDHCVEKCKELYALYCFGKTLLSDDDKHTVKGMYYFLRRADDTDEEFQEDFTGDEGEGKNVVGINVYTSREQVDVIDQVYEPQFAEYVAGKDIECGSRACENCGLSPVCNYKSAPIVPEKEREARTVGDINLSDLQRKIVMFRDGVARVNAGAGCGKTLVVTLRYAFMLSEGIDPDRILLLTFTDAGAREMRERTLMYCEDLGESPDPEKLHCMTFNAFGNEIIKAEFERLGFKEVPKIIDDIERKGIITRDLDANEIDGLDYKNYTMDQGQMKGALAVVSEAFHIIKRDNLGVYSLEAFKEAMRKAGLNSYIKRDSAYQEILEAYDRFDDALREHCLIEYADQERLIFDLLAMDPYYFERFGYEHIVCDEFQDTSENQMVLLRRLYETGAKSLLVVGHDAQSIYRFRDADVRNIVDFFDIMGVQGIDLDLLANYRSSGAIVEFANKLIALNQYRVEKDMVATRPYGEKPIAKGFLKKDEEYNFIAEEIKRMLGEGKAPEEIAVIAATRAELLSMADVMTEHGIATCVTAPEPMLENDRVRAVIALCNAMQDTSATGCALAVLAAKEDGKLLERRTAQELEQLKLDYIDEITKANLMFESGRIKWFTDEVQAICESDEIALNMAERLAIRPTMKEKFDYVKEFVEFKGASVKRDGRRAGVVLSTAHSSKGLEWPVVFVSLTKFDRERISTEELEERRRLFFVAATRARDLLYLTGQYRMSGNLENGYTYNRFLSEAYDILGGNMLKACTDEEEAIEKAKLEAKAKEREEKAKARAEAREKARAEKEKAKEEEKARKAAEKEREKAEKAKAKEEAKAKAKAEKAAKAKTPVAPEAGSETEAEPNFRRAFSTFYKVE